MKRLSLILVVMLLMGVLVAPSFAKTTGNGAPSGPHYTLNIIGTSEKNMDNPQSNGHVIFALYNKASGKVSTRIMLSQGEKFSVLDKNGTDGEAAFQLPNDLYLSAEVDGTIISKYAVYVRALGKPGSATITPGFIDESGVEWFSVGTVTVKKKAGQAPKFVNATRELFSVTYYDPILADYVTAPLFADELCEYFWDLDGNLRHLQMRFYEETTYIK